jgi:hypothetical protein
MRLPDYSVVGLPSFGNAPNIFGYTREEIQEWIAKRDPLTHADSRTAKTILFDTDVRGIIHRVEQASLDVLFNKKDWGTWSSSRRESWTPEGWTSGSGPAGVGVFGTSPTRVLMLSDPFDVYPISSTTVTPQPGWLLCGFPRVRPNEDIAG